MCKDATAGSLYYCPIQVSSSSIISESFTNNDTGGACSSIPQGGSDSWPSQILTASQISLDGYSAKVEWLDTRRLLRSVESMFSSGAEHRPKRQLQCPRSAGSAARKNLQSLSLIMYKKYYYKIGSRRNAMINNTLIKDNTFSILLHIFLSY
jgi:hypothetical protein